MWNAEELLKLVFKNKEAFLKHFSFPTILDL